jgi:hypothetical protein
MGIGAFSCLGSADSVKTHTRGVAFGLAWLWQRVPTQAVAAWSSLGGVGSVQPDCGGADLGLVAVAFGLGSATVGLPI